MESGGTGTVPVDQAQNRPETANYSADRAKAMELTKYHAADVLQIECMGRVRKATEELIIAIVVNCPSNSDRSTAIRKARECLMTANASIVLPAGVTDFR